MRGPWTGVVAGAAGALVSFVPVVGFRRCGGAKYVRGTYQDGKYSPPLNLIDATFQ